MEKQKPQNPDLTEWVSIEQWDKCQHWFTRGDLVEFYCRGGLFNHWTMYIGDGQVVHMTSRDLGASAFEIAAAASEMSPRNSKWQLVSKTMRAGVDLFRKEIPPSSPGKHKQDSSAIRIDAILRVATKMNGPFRVHNQRCPRVKHAVRSWDEISALIERYVGQDVIAYCKMTMNCEHFATFLRYKDA